MNQIILNILFSFKIILFYCYFFHLHMFDIEVIRKECEGYLDNIVDYIFWEVVTNSMKPSKSLVQVYTGICEHLY